MSSRKRPGLQVTIVGDPGRCFAAAIGKAVDATRKLAPLVERALEGVDLDAVDELVELLDDPDLMERFGDRDIREAPQTLAEIRSGYTAMRPGGAVTVTRGLARPRTQGRSPGGRSRSRAVATRRAVPARESDDPHDPGDIDACPRGCGGVVVQFYAVRLCAHCWATTVLQLQGRTA